ncbi:MAG: hypothetical protein Q9M91_04810 [Candidatus Dojkabacteria bacterium]|nr:hypothetical protein [Candidatus Dojkabacteria bacterium]MDQ7021129.1 hypothetical protein [Candidatus Dojkabacteria bacterium]
MNSTKLLKKLEKRDIELAPIDKETADKIKDIVRLTDSNAMTVINEAVKILEKALGRELILRKPDSKWDIKINKYTKFKTISDVEPNKE